jgi:hypothetical protein
VLQVQRLDQLVLNDKTANWITLASSEQLGLSTSNAINRREAIEYKHGHRLVRNGTALVGQHEKGSFTTLANGLWPKAERFSPNQLVCELIFVAIPSSHLRSC